MVAHPRQFTGALNQVLGTNYSQLQLLELKGLKDYVGQPDQVYVDETTKQILLLEIKVGTHKTTKYTADQHRKYLFLSQIIGQLPRFNPDYNVHHILLAHTSDLLKICDSSLRKTEPMKEEDGLTWFINTDRMDCRSKSKQRYGNPKSIDELIRERHHALGSTPPQCSKHRLLTQVVSWDMLFRASPNSQFATEMNPIMPYLTGTCDAE